MSLLLLRLHAVLLLLLLHHMSLLMPLLHVRLPSRLLPAHIMLLLQLYVNIMRWLWHILPSIMLRPRLRRLLSSLRRSLTVTATATATATMVVPMLSATAMATTTLMSKLRAISFLVTWFAAHKARLFERAVPEAVLRVATNVAKWCKIRIDHFSLHRRRTGSIPTTLAALGAICRPCRHCSSCGWATSSPRACG